MPPIEWGMRNGIPVGASGLPLRLRTLPPGSVDPTNFGAGNGLMTGAGLQPMNFGGGSGFGATGLGGRAPQHDNWYPRFKRKATQHELRSPTDKMARSEYVFRGAGPNSGGINNPQGLIAGMYKQLPMAGVPSMDDIGRPGGRWSMTLKELEMRTKSHFDRTNNIPTPWISTSPSLEKALAYMIEFCPNDGFIFVIRIDDCQDIFDAEDMTEALPGIGKLLRNKWQAVMDDEGKIDEYVIFGKVPRHAIAATISGPRLLSCEALYTVGPPVALHVQAKLNKRPSQKVLEQLERRVPHKISNTLLTAAIEVVSRFEGADENCFFWVVRVLLGTDFQNPYEERQDGRRVRQAVEGFLLGRMMLQNET